MNVFLLFLTLEIFKLTGQYKYQIAEDVMADTLSTKEIIYRASLKISRGMKNAVSTAIASGIGILIRNKNVTSEKHKTENLLK